MVLVLLSAAVALCSVLPATLDCVDILTPALKLEDIHSNFFSLRNERRRALTVPALALRASL